MAGDKGFQLFFVRWRHVTELDPAPLEVGRGFFEFGLQGQIGCHREADLRDAEFFGCPYVHFGPIGNSVPAVDVMKRQAAQADIDDGSDGHMAGVYGSKSTLLYFESP